MKQRPHAATIIEWANGAQIQYRQHVTHPWKDCNDPAFLADWEYRVKPAGPEYPTSKMDDGIFFAILSGRHPEMNITAGYRAIANAALRHAIDAGQVVTREEFDRALGNRAERDRSVAIGVREGIVEELRAAKFHEAVIEAVRTIDLAAITAEVK